MSQKPTDVDQYIATFPPERQAVLSELRRIVKNAAPEAVESLAYGMAGFKLGGRPLIYFAGWKDHYSLYPFTGAVLKAHSAELEGFTFSKGTIRFPAGRPVPYDLVSKLVKTRVAEVEG